MLTYQNLGPAHRKVRKLWKNPKWRARQLRRLRRPRTVKQKSTDLRNIRLANSLPKTKSQRAASRLTIEFAHAGLKKKRREKNGICEICGIHCFSYKDHDHKTGKQRGILCFNCNCGIGLFKDNVERLKKTIDYLEKYKVHRFPRTLRFPRLKKFVA